MSTKLKNKGTGAGGSNTNKNGLKYEAVTNLDEYIIVITKERVGRKIKFSYSDDEFIELHKAELVKYTQNMDKNDTNSDIERLHGTKEPDTAYINEAQKIIIILEKKFQQGGGSAAEKLQTYPNKIRNYRRRYPNHTIHYIYWISEWFINTCKQELKDCEEDQVPVFIGNNEDVKVNLVDFILSC
jgi:hypothetical protein